MSNCAENWARKAAAARGPCPMCANDPQIQKDLERQLIELRDEIERLQKQYDELLYAVEQKWPNETRHQTALRYILDREADSKINQSGTDGIKNNP